MDSEQFDWLRTADPFDSELLRRVVWGQFWFLPTNIGRDDSLEEPVGHRDVKKPGMC